MVNLIKNEVFKIFKQKKLYILMAIISLLGILQFIGYLALKVSKGAEEAKKTFAFVNGQTFPIMMLGLASTPIIIYVVILLADIITDEYRNGTLKLSLLQPITRNKLLVSKVIGLLVGILCLHLFTLVVSYALGTAFYGWGDKFTFTGFKLGNLGESVRFTYSFSAINGVLFTIGSYLLMVIPYFAFGMMVFFISLMFSNMGAAIGTSLGIWFAMSLLSNLIKRIRPFTIDTYYTFYMEFAKDPSARNIITGFSVIAAYSIIFFIAGMLAFRKKDILL